MKLNIRKDTIFSILAGAGVLFTAVTTFFGTKRYLEEINNVELALYDPSSKLRTIKVAARSAVPALAATGGALFSIAKAHDSASEIIKGLGATAGYLAMNRNQLKDIVRKNDGTQGTALSPYAYCPKYPEVGSIENTGNGDLLCLEGYSGRWFLSSETAVRDAIAHFQRRFENGEYLSLNDFYEELGITTSHFGHQYGWAANTDYYDAPLDFETTLIDDYLDNNGRKTGVPCLVIDIYTYPMECYMEV